MKSVVSGINEAADKLHIDREIVYYGARVDGLFLIECFLSLAVSYFLGVFYNALLFIVLFSYLREYCGGFHCKKYISCTCLYIFMVTSGSFLSRYTTLLASEVVLLVSAILLYIVSPVQNENKRISYKEEFRLKRIARRKIRYSIYLYIVAVVIGDYDWCIPISYAFLWLTILCVIQMKIEGEKLCLTFMNSLYCC